MSTEKTEKTTENKTNDNKKVFSPLGKYAAVAVVMVSIIVTTAIMLNKQVGTVDEQLATIESEVAEMNAANSTNTVTTDISEATTSSAAIIETQDTEETAETEVTPAKIQAAKVQAVEAPSTEVLLVIENTAKETVSETIISTEQTSYTDAAAIEPAMRKNSSADNHAQLTMVNRDQERQARIESFKLEQKQHMAEMFVRIKSLEAQQLDKYKTSQDKQVKRLRQRIARQEQLIEALILRNKERIEMRAASLQRSQSNREKMLNRI